MVAIRKQAESSQPSTCEFVVGVTRFELVTSSVSGMMKIKACGITVID